MFSNPDVALETLPSLEQPVWQALDASFVRRLQLHTLIVLAFPAAALIIGMFVPLIPWTPIGVGGVILLLLGASMLAWPMVSVPRRGFVVRDKDIVFRAGVFWRSVTAIPFNRIQHVETSSGPLDRRYQLATLQLFTAGGSGGDLKIDGLNRSEAEKLRAFLLAKAGSSIEHA